MHVPPCLGSGCTSCYAVYLLRNGVVTAWRYALVHRGSGRFVVDAFRAVGDAAPGCGCGQVDHSPRLKPGDSWADHRSPSELGASYTVMSWPEATSTSVDSRRPCGMWLGWHTWSFGVQLSGTPDGARRFLPMAQARGLHAARADNRVTLSWQSMETSDALFRKPNPNGTSTFGGYRRVSQRQTLNSRPVRRVDAVRRYRRSALPATKTRLATGRSPPSAEGRQRRRFPRSYTSDVRRCSPLSASAGVRFGVKDGGSNSSFVDPGDASARVQPRPPAPMNWGGRGHSLAAVEPRLTVL